MILGRLPTQLIHKTTYQGEILTLSKGNVGTSYSCSCAQVPWQNTTPRRIRCNPCKIASSRCCKQSTLHLPHTQATLLLMSIVLDECCVSVEDMLSSVKTHPKVDAVVFKDIHSLIVSSRMQKACGDGLLEGSPQRENKWMDGFLMPPHCYFVLVAWSSARVLILDC